MCHCVRKRALGGRWYCFCCMEGALKNTGMSKKNSPREAENQQKASEIPQEEIDMKENEPNREGRGAAESEPAGTSESQDLKAQLADMNDKYLRLYSDFDNYRRRANKEKLELIKTASSAVVLSLLPVIDDMERAIKAISEAEKGEGQKALAEGVELIYNKLMGTLKQHGLSECEVSGKPFDPDTAEAVAQIPAPEESLKGQVLEVVQKGYSLEGKVLRFAKVVVGC